MDWFDPTRRNVADAFSLDSDKQSRGPLGPTLRLRRRGGRITNDGTNAVILPEPGNLRRCICIGRLSDCYAK